MARVSAPQTQLVAEATESAEAHEAVESELAATSWVPSGEYVMARYQWGAVCR